jgi:hypothetical protein
MLLHFKRTGWRTVDYHLGDREQADCLGSVGNKDQTCCWVEVISRLAYQGINLPRLDPLVSDSRRPDLIVAETL